MNDNIIPDNSNKLAQALSLIFHPYVIFVPPSVLIFGHEGIIWAILTGVIVVTPIAITVLILGRNQRYVFEREARTPLYIVGWIAVLVCFAVLTLLSAPDVIRTGVLVVAIWTPLQFLINSTITKASVHASLVAIVFSGLLSMGYLNDLPIFIISLLIVLAVSWSRMKTRNHTPTQIILGLLTGTLATLLAFLMFR